MSRSRLVLRGSASNILRLLLSMLAAMFVPPFLVRHLSQAEYSAWVLILQLSAYVNLLDLGLQTAVGKFVAEYHAIGDHEANRRLVSTSLTAILGAALIAAGLVIVMVVRVPELFHQMPQGLLSQVRLSLLVVGLSAAFALPFSPFLSVFTGLQDYAFPTILTIVSRVFSVIALMTLLLLHGGLIELALTVALFNVVTAVAQFHGWRRYAREFVAFSFPFFDRQSAIQLSKYSGVLVIWTLAGLCVSGLDLVIVGHFDYKNTGFYAIGSSVTNFMLMIMTGVMGPLIPAVSSLQADKTPGQIGELTVRATRYGTLLLCLLGLPLMIGAYPLLSLWVGREYALHSSQFLQLLVLANIVRLLAYPYSIVVVATGKQHLATAAAVAEAVVNLGLSVWLVQRMGALGVAIGTLIGAFVSLSLHFLVSMRLTESTVSFQTERLIMQGLLRPLASALPLLLICPYGRRNQMIPVALPLLLAWVILTVAVAWMVGLNSEDRRYLQAVVRRNARV